MRCQNWQIQDGFMAGMMKDDTMTRKIQDDTMTGQLQDEAKTGKEDNGGLSWSGAAGDG
jgi:hypothetical protein